MTQKSVSIRANVSIRGVTIRAYALYNIRNIFINNTKKNTVYFMIQFCYRSALK